MSKRARGGEMVTVVQTARKSRRPIDKSIVAVFENPLNATQKNTVLKRGNW